MGPSLKVPQKRALAVSKLMLPYEPFDVLAELTAYRQKHPDPSMPRSTSSPSAASRRVRNGSTSTAVP